MAHQEIELRDGEVITVRPFATLDLPALHRMYSLLGDESRAFYRSELARPRPSAYRPKAIALWLANKLRLVLSSIGPTRKCLMSIPLAACFAFVALNSRHEVVGFTHFSVVGHRAGHKGIGEIGGVVRDDYQGRGLAAPLSRITLDLVTGDLEIIISEIDVANRRTIHIARKLGYRIFGSGSRKNGEAFCLMARLTKDSEYQTTTPHLGGSGIDNTDLLPVQEHPELSSTPEKIGQGVHGIVGKPTYENMESGKSRSERMPLGVELRGGETVIVRTFTAKDIRGLRRMYSLLSDESKSRFTSEIICSRPSAYTPRGLIVWAANMLRLRLSAHRPTRRCLRHVSQAVCLGFVAVNSVQEIVGFQYFSILGRRVGSGCIAESGTILRDDYQSKGLGTELLRIGLNGIAGDVDVVLGQVNVENTRVIRVCEKLGFKIVGSYRDKDHMPSYMVVWMAQQQGVSNQASSL